MKIGIRLLHCLRKAIVLIAAPTMFASSALADPALPIWQFDVLAVTSAWYNPAPPSGLTPDNVLYELNWDVDYSPNQIKTSALQHGGGWVAFITETGGYSVSPPIPTYPGASLIYFGQHLVTHNGSVIGFDDEWVCSCNGGQEFSAATTSITPPYGYVYTHTLGWNAGMYVR